MNKHGDQFLEMFKESFGDYSPEVPSAVYAGVRKKMFWSNFMGFNMAQLNIWYVLLATSSVALLSWSNLEQESIGSMASESDYQIIELREPMLASVNSPLVDEVSNTCVQFSPKRTNTTVVSNVSNMVIAEEVQEASVVETAQVAEVVESHVEEAIASVEESTTEESLNENVISNEHTEVVEEISEIAHQDNLPMNMGGALVEDSNLVDQLKKNDGPIELNIHVKKTSSKEK